MGLIALAVVLVALLSLAVTLLLRNEPSLPRWTVPLLVAIVAAALLRSAVATRLDGFTVDEPYHVTAGVSYFERGDFRLNPEHPPLVKLWVGAAESLAGFALPPFRPLVDKPDERRFTQTAVYLDNDFARVQAVARGAMLALNGLLLFLFGLAAARVLRPAWATGALVFLAIDPTVAAHLPVVMTDLPIALTAATAVLLAVRAWRTWAPRDLGLAALALGLALATKHSGIVVAGFVGLTGLAAAVWQGVRNRYEAVQGLQSEGRKSGRRTVAALGRVAAVLGLAFLVLWGSYGFRHRAGREAAEGFNRGLDEKIADLYSPLHQRGMTLLAAGHLLPRAYLWGLADVLRSGMEGRGGSMFCFGRVFPAGAPAYYFPGMLAVKLPLGLTALSLLGAALLVARREGCEAGPHLVALGLVALGAFGFLYLAILASGAAHAGIRHAMPVFPVMAVLAGVALAELAPRATLTGARAGRGWRLAIAAALVAALVAALPVVRPWESFNALAGGSANAWTLFADEGVDLGQRSQEVARYYEENLRPRGEVPFFLGVMLPEEIAARKIVARDWESFEADPGAGDALSGTVFFNAIWITAFDLPDVRAARPIDRLGNVFVYRGTFRIPWRQAMTLRAQAGEALLSGDRAAAEHLLAESVAAFPGHFPVAIELGNLLAARGAREEAIAAFELAYANTPPDQPIRELIRHHLERLRSEPLAGIPELRSPWSE